VTMDTIVAQDSYHSLHWIEFCKRVATERYVVDSPVVSPRNAATITQDLNKFKQLQCMKTVTLGAFFFAYLHGLFQPHACFTLVSVTYAGPSRIRQRAQFVVTT
jgi:hypothetical protein